MISNEYKENLLELLSSLGIPSSYVDTCKLPIQMEAAALVSAGLDIFGRDQLMTPQTLSAWQKMQEAAASANVELQLVSAFRSLEYQCGIIQRKIENGIELNDILKVSAAPGFSEHHTGRALDLSTPGIEPLNETFELTEAFSWLQTNADHFGFQLSYPRENPWDIIYEPWHWAWTPS